MSEASINIITILLLTVVPLILLGIHIFLSMRRNFFLWIIIPVLWTSLGTWMILAGYKVEGFATELFLFFLAGDLLMISATILLQRWQKLKK